MAVIPSITDIIIPLVNSSDEIIGSGEKIDVHLKGLLHRAFSVLIFNQKGQMLIHQRALGKYHSPGLWTNACCGHPFIGEEMKNAAERRLLEEMGISCELEYNFTFQYRSMFENGLIENEIDHVYKGIFEGNFETNPDEVADYKWQNIIDIKKDIQLKPDSFTIWFKEIMKVS
jgi:isopentenyl-diphosphate delta-isomerase